MTEKRRVRGRWRRLLLATTVLAGLTAPGLAAAQDLNVPDNTTVDETVGFAYDNVTVGNNAILNIGDPPNPVSISAAMVTTINNGGQLIVLDDGTYTATGATNINSAIIQVQNGGTYVANSVVTNTAGTIQIDLGGTFDANAVINGSIETDIIIVNGTMTYDAVQFGFGNGDDVLQVAGNFQVNLGAGNVITMGDGDDFVVFTGTPTLSVSLPGINAGLGTQPNGDTLQFDGGTDSTFSGAENFTNFEHLQKLGTNTWTLNADTVTGVTVEDVFVSQGTLRLTGLWVITAGATAVNAGATLDIGDGALSTNFTATGTALVSGTLNVADMASAGFTGDMTVVNGGSVTVANGGGLGVTGAVAVNVGGSIVLDGGMTGGDTTVSGSMMINGSGSYNSSGSVTVDNNAMVTVGGGSLASTTNLFVAGTAQIALTSGSVTSGANFFISEDGSVVVSGGNFNATASTSLFDNATLQVLGGNYIATGQILIADNARLIVDDQFVPVGVVFANSTTQIQGGGGLLVEGGAYNATGQIFATGPGSFVAVRDNGVISAMGTTNLVNLASLVVFSGGEYQAAGTITLDGGAVAGDGLISGMQLLDNTSGIVLPASELSDIGTLNFVGTYQQAAAASFFVDILPGGVADRFAITGPASLAGTVRINLPAAGFAGPTQVRIMSTTAPINGIFDTATLVGAAAGDVIVWVGRVDDAGVFNAADPSTGNNVDVIVVPAGANQNFGAETPNQQAVADYLGGGFPGGSVFIEDASFFDLLGLLAAGPNALDQIGGEVYDSFTAFSFNIARQFGGLVDNRVRTLRCAASGGGLRGPSAPFCGPNRTLLADAGPGLAPGAGGTTSPLGFSPNTHPYGWSVWAQAIGSYLSKDRTTNNLGYSGWTGGGAIGVDLALSQRWIVGVLAGGTRSNIDFSGVSGDGDLEAVTVGVYTAWYGSRWFANAAFTYTKTWVEADRDLTFLATPTTAKGKTEGDQYAIHATVGYGFKINKFSLEATGGIDWVQLRQYGFTETDGGNFNLTVRTRTDDSLRLRIGIRVARAWKVRPNLIIAPSFRVGYAREVLDNTRPITSSLASIGGSFTVNGDEGSRNILTYGGGIQADFSQGITLYLRHSGEWAVDRSGHTFNAGIRIRW